jgi:hypothetical protein
VSLLICGYILVHVDFFSGHRNGSDAIVDERLSLLTCWAACRVDESMLHFAEGSDDIDIVDMLSRNILYANSRPVGKRPFVLPKVNCLSLPRQAHRRTSTHCPFSLIT